MKVLVVDDDPLMRRLVVRLASRHPDVVIREAEHGADALAQIEAERPDLVFTDVEMPYLDGLGLLEAIRASARHGDLPVVAVSAVADKALVLRMVDLGIEGYLLKPLDPASAAGRFDDILARVAARAAAPAPTSDRRTLLLVDHESGYGEVVRAAVGGGWHVRDDLTAAAALAWGVEHQPAVALVAEGLATPSADAFARALHSAGGTRVVLLHDGDPPEPSDHVAAIVPRSHVPATLRAALDPVLASVADDGLDVAALLRDVVIEAVAAAGRQALGLVTGQESQRTDGIEGAPPADTSGRVVLSRSGTGEVVTLMLAASASDLSALQAGDTAALLDALLTPIAARAAHVLGAHGVTVGIGALAVAAEPPAAEEPTTASCALRTDGGQWLHLSLGWSRAPETTE